MRASHLSSVVLAYILISTVEITNGAKILFFLGLSSHSHRVAIQPLATALADRGHDVTFFSPIEPEVPNPKIKEFCPQLLKDMNEVVVKSSGDCTARYRDKTVEIFGGNEFWDLLYMAAKANLEDREFLNWLNNSTFDLIIHDHPGRDYIYAFAHHIVAKVIAFVPAATQYSSDFDTFGYSIESWFLGQNSNHYWYISDRVFNAFNTIKQYLSYKDNYIAKMDALARKQFHFDFPPLMDLMKKTDMIFLNEHFSGAYARPLPPNIIAVGGMHAKEFNDPLPTEIENFLTDAEQFIYLSFGSVINISMLPSEVQQNFFEAISTFPKTKFLWKWAEEVPQNMPSNVLPRKWFPQQGVLAHPKCKGFMTQAGQMSMQQAIYHGVPIIVVPVFADQVFNAKVAEHHNLGLRLELMDITKDTLAHAFGELLNNKRYRESAQAVSKRFRDRPMSALDTAVWWAEYVLRHDTEHLRSEGTYLTWIQRRSLDVWLLAFSAVAVLLMALTYTFKKLLVALLYKSDEKQKKN